MEQVLPDPRSTAMMAVFPDPRASPMGLGIQHKKKSLRNANKKRVRARKHKLRSAKKVKRLKGPRMQARNA